MPDRSLTLSLLPDIYAVCRLDGGAPVPAWALSEGFSSITRTDDELSIVRAQRMIPDGVAAEREWRCLKVEGPLDFALTGVLAGIATTLAHADVSIFAVSTYDTDYILVKEQTLPHTIDALSRQGYHIRIRIRA